MSAHAHTHAFTHAPPNKTIPSFFPSPPLLQTAHPERMGNSALEEITEIIKAHKKRGMDCLYVCVYFIVAKRSVHVIVKCRT